MNDDGSIEIPPIESAEAFEARVAPTLVKPFASQFGALFLDHLDDPGPEHEWLIDGWLSIGDKSVIGGPSQSGKSFLAIHAGLCVAHNLEFFGAAVKPGLVIYQAGEGARGVKKRLRAWRKHFAVSYSRGTPFVLLQGKIDLYRPDDTPKLIAEIQAIAALYDVPLAAVFIDTLATAAIGAEENSSRDMGMVLDNIATLNTALKCHVSLVHHMNAGGEKLRGSTAIFANIDQTIFVKQNDVTKIRTATLGKQRDDDSRITFQFELMSVELGVYPNGKPITSCVCLNVGEKEAVRRAEEQKGFVLKPDEASFMHAYFEAEAKYGEPVPANLDLPSSARSIIDYEKVKALYAAKNPDHEVDAPPDEAETDEAAEKRRMERDKKRRYRLSTKIKALCKPLMNYGVVGFAEHDKRWLIYWLGKPLRGFAETMPREPEDEGVPF